MDAIHVRLVDSHIKDFSKRRQLSPHSLSKTVGMRFTQCIFTLLLLHLLIQFACSFNRHVVVPRNTNPLNAFSRHAEIFPSPRSEQLKVLDDATGYCGEFAFDLSSPRLWLEYHEMNEGRHGAYTVMRCDFSPATNSWKIWGFEFHLQRLLTSLRLIEKQAGRDDLESIIENAVNSTIQVKEKLLNQTIDELGDSLRFERENDDGVLTIMFTCLWTLVEDEVKVSGHIFTSGSLVNPMDYNPQPGIAAVAKEWSEHANEFPSRLDGPVAAKSSSWCRLRRPLENTFKTEDISEVILTSQVEEETFLLEGLTSNLFVLYRDGTLRTSADDVCLPGYARSRILECAERLGIPVNLGPVSLSESSEWQEVFVSSAIRLIVPICKVVVPRFDANAISRDEAVWNSEACVDNVSLWRNIYCSLLD